MSKGGPIDREKIYKKIGEDLGIPAKDVEEAVRHEFKFVKKIMERGNFNSVRLPRFGIFEVKEKRLKKMRKYNER